MTGGVEVASADGSTKSSTSGTDAQAVSNLKPTEKIVTIRNGEIGLVELKIGHGRGLDMYLSDKKLTI